MRTRLYFIVPLVLSLLFPSDASALIPIKQADLSQPTGVAPAFFGPNAFPIPEMSTGKIPSAVCVDVSGDVYKGFIRPGAEDMTYDAYVNLRIPLYKERVGLYIWAVPQEWFSMDREVMDARRILADDGKRRLGGDISVVLEMLLLEEKERVPAVTVRSVLKSASGGEFDMARYYDCPGYFFDLTVSKSVISSGTGPVRDLRFGASTGFLCWQTDNGRQNDAVQYGVCASVRTAPAALYTQFSGYSGWERYGDCPMSLTARVNIVPDKAVSPFFQYQHGLRDWPFDQYRFGLSVSFK